MTFVAATLSARRVTPTTGAIDPFPAHTTWWENSGTTLAQFDSERFLEIDMQIEDFLVRQYGTEIINWHARHSVHKFDVQRWCTVPKHVSLSIYTRTQGRLTRGGSRGVVLGVRTPPPFWGTPKLHKDGENVASVHTKMPHFSINSYPDPPPFPKSCIRLWVVSNVKVCKIYRGGSRGYCGAQHLTKRGKNTFVVLNSYPKPPFRNPVSAPVIYL